MEIGHSHQVTPKSNEVAPLFIHVFQLKSEIGDKKTRQEVEEEEEKAKRTEWMYTLFFSRRVLNALSVESALSVLFQVTF